jgi:HK97 gp10 family phage protein
MSLSYNVELQGLDALIADAKKAGANATPLVKAAVVNSTSKVQERARSRAAHRTGTLQRSIQRELKDTAGRTFVGEKYGIFIEKGTGLYGPERRPIRAKRAKVLAFTVGSKKVFTKSVKGMRAKPFFKPALEESKPHIKQQFDKVADILVKQLAGKK